MRASLWAARADPQTPRTWCGKTRAACADAGGHICGRLTPTRWRHPRGMASLGRRAPTRSHNDMCEQVRGRLAPTHKHHIHGVAKPGRLAPTRTHSPTRWANLRAAYADPLAPHARHSGTWTAFADPVSPKYVRTRFCGRLAPTHMHHIRGVARLGRLAPTQTHADTHADQICTINVIEG